MPEDPKLSPPSIEEEASKAYQRATRQMPKLFAPSIRSIPGLAVVSILNICCVAFIAFHFMTHEDQPAQTEQIKLSPGNVSLEPVSTYLLAIPSHIIESSRDVDAPAEEEMIASVPESTRTVTASKRSTLQSDATIQEVSIKEGDYSVQLGALSELATARSYWVKLQKRHASLLSSYQPRIVGPDQVGGKLYHLRVGPLTASLAASLCSDLQGAGADCFCVTDRSKKTEHIDVAPLGLTTR